MDAFFAAVEERDNLRFKGKPIVVGSDPKEGAGRGVVSTANYAARAYGIHSAMPISRAWKLSEQARLEGKEKAIFVSPSMGKYAKVSEEIRSMVQAYFPVIEQASIDEFYADASGYGSYAKVEAVCRELKATIKEKERVTASVGIGPNKLVAKIASDRQKPDGLTIVTPREVFAFLDPLSIRVIPGIGPKTEKVLAREKIRTIGDLRSLSRDDLEDLFGDHGRAFYDKARGEDDRPVEESREIKSIGEQETFETDTKDTGSIIETLKRLVSGVVSDMRKKGFSGARRITITVRFNDFETVTRSRTISKPITNEADAFQYALQLLLPFFDTRENPNKKTFRLIGFRFERLLK
jgi:nucleotidyltransferase/DNA polymerase involved in DNA repair